LRGKQPKLIARQEAHLVELHRGGEHTTAELAELFNVARSTVYRALDRALTDGADTRGLTGVVRAVGARLSAPPGSQITGPGGITRFWRVLLGSSRAVGRRRPAS
jgi:hypothetical protein